MGKNTISGCEVLSHGLSLTFSFLPLTSVEMGDLAMVNLSYFLKERGIFESIIW